MATLLLEKTIEILSFALTTGEEVENNYYDDEYTDFLEDKFGRYGY